MTARPEAGWCSRCSFHLARPGDPEQLCPVCTGQHLDAEKRRWQRLLDAGKGQADG